MPARTDILTQSRGVAALMVAFSHCLYLFTLGSAGALSAYPSLEKLTTVPEALARWMLAYGGHGRIAVIYFFLLSGYVLALSMNRFKRGAVPWWREWPGFVLKRLCRILPAHAVVLAIMALVLTLAGGTAAHPALSSEFLTWLEVPTWRQLGSDLLLQSHAVNPVGWTLYWEMLAGLWLLPAVALTRGPRTGVAILLALLVLDIAKASMFNIFTYAWVFYAGALLAMYGYRLHKQVTAGYVAMAFVATASLELVIPNMADNTTLHIVRICQVITSVAVLLTLLERPRLTGGRWLESLGRASYSFYLIHPIILWLTAVGVLLTFPVAWVVSAPLLWTGVIGALSIALAWLAAVVLFVLVEKPGIELGRRAANLVRKV